MWKSLLMGWVSPSWKIDREAYFWQSTREMGHPAPPVCRSLQLRAIIFFGGVLISCAWSAMLNQRSQLEAGTMEDSSCNGPRLLLRKFA